MYRTTSSVYMGFRTICRYNNSLYPKARSAPAPWHRRGRILRYLQSLDFGLCSRKLLGANSRRPLVDWLSFAGSTPILQIWALVMLITDIIVLFWLTRNPLVTRRKGRTREFYTRIEWPKLLSFKYILLNQY